MRMPRTEATFQQIRDQRREQILRTAAKVFRQKGFASTKIADLAEAADISQGLLYRYFASKEKVLAALLVEATQTAFSLAEAALERPGGPWEGLYWFTEQLLNVMQTQPDLCYCFSQVSAVPGILRDPAAKLNEALRRLIVANVAGGDAAQRDPDEMVLLYLCCIQGIAAGTLVYGDWMMEHFPTAETVLRMFKQDV
jgi:AcrR family transcriptional regulator